VKPSRWERRGNAVAEETTNIDELTIGIDRGQTVSGREISDELTIRYVISCISDDKTVNAVSLHRLENLLICSLIDRCADQCGVD
jgi:hypothetical protein